MRPIIIGLALHHSAARSLPTVRTNPPNDIVSDTVFKVRSLLFFSDALSVHRITSPLAHVPTKLQAHIALLGK